MAREERWTHHGLWGAVKSSESEGLRAARDMVESGKARAKSNTSQLAYMRSYEMAKKLGMKAEAEAIDGKMRKLAEWENDRNEKRPQKIPGNGKTSDLYVRRYMHNGERVVCISHDEDNCK